MPETISEVLVSVVDEVEFDDETHRSRGEKDEIHCAPTNGRVKAVRK